MKIKTIHVCNIKAVVEQKLDLNGSSCMVTGKNNSGKSTLLTALPDRLRQIKPSIILKEGEHNEFYEMVLTDGNIFRWDVTDKTKAGEKLTFITKDNIKAPVTREIANKYFPSIFNVDQFLQDPPAKQRKTLQDLVGLDFTDIDKRYDVAYKDREDKNRRAGEWKIRFQGTEVAAKFEVVDMGDLSAKKEKIRADMAVIYRANQANNTETRSKYEQHKQKIDKEVFDFNKDQDDQQVAFNASDMAYRVLSKHGYMGTEVNSFLNDLFNNIQPKKDASKLYDPAPTDLSQIPEDYAPHEFEQVIIKELSDDTALKIIDQEIINATEINHKAKVYSDYIALRDQSDQYTKDANEADGALKGIEKERMELIKSAKMPEGFSFSDNGILYNGLAFTREQLSSSGIYIAALKLAEMQLGEVRTLHFDASFLDKNSLAEIEKWAESVDLQILVERPSWESEEIQYQLINQSV